MFDRCVLVCRDVVVVLLQYPVRPTTHIRKEVENQKTENRVNRVNPNTPLVRKKKLTSFFTKSKKVCSAHFLILN
jgi:hypothetical protein